MTNLAKKRKRINIILQTIFWIATAYWFTKNASIRPYSTPFREIICAFFIATCIYLNYFVLFPQFYIKRKYFVYIILSIICLLLSSLGEFIVVKKFIVRCYQYTISPNLILRFLIDDYCLISFRDFGFLCFFILLRIYQLAVYNTEIEKQSLAKNIGIYNVIPLSGKIKQLNINKICYFESNKNIVDIFMKNRFKYQQYMSLSDVEEILPKELYIRVNRCSIVMLSSIIRYTDEGLVVSLNNRFVPYYLTKPQEIKDKLYQWNPKLYCPTDENLATPDTVFRDDDTEVLPKNAEIDVEKSQQCDEFLSNGVEKSTFLEENPGLVRLYDYIKEHPNAKTNQMTTDLHIPRRSLQRQLKSLVDAQLIMHVGSRGESSGYKTIDK